MHCLSPRRPTQPSGAGSGDGCPLWRHPPGVFRGPLPFGLFGLVCFFLAGEPLAGLGVAIALDALGQLYRPLHFGILQRAQRGIELPHQRIAVFLLDEPALDQAVNGRDPLATVREAEAGLQRCLLDGLAAIAHDLLKPFLGHIGLVAQKRFKLRDHLLPNARIHRRRVGLFHRFHHRRRASLIQTDRGCRLPAIHCGAGWTCHGRCYSALSIEFEYQDPGSCLQARVDPM